MTTEILTIYNCRSSKGYFINHINHRRINYTMIYNNLSTCTRMRNHKFGKRKRKYIHTSRDRLNEEARFSRNFHAKNASHEPRFSSSLHLCPSRGEQLFNKLSFLSGTPDKLSRGRMLADTGGYLIHRARSLWKVCYMAAAVK